jgi:dihydrofolate reductase
MYMSKTIAVFAMSLDGFIADPEDDVGRLFGWLSGGDTPFPIPGEDRVFMTSPASAEHYREIFETTGAAVTGRRDFDVSNAWGGKYPMGVPAFIVTHTVPQEWAGEGSPFTFVTDGIESALEKAKAAAGDKAVLVSGSKITQQCLKAGLLDEIQIDLVPVLLGAGVRLFDHLGTEPIALDSTSVVSAPGVTHLKYRVVREP